MGLNSITKILLSAALLALGSAAPAAERAPVTGLLQGPGGEAVDGATVYICTGLVKAEKAGTPNASGKQRMVLYYSTENGAGRCDGTGRTNREGKFSVRYPVGQKGDFFAWKKGYQALIVRGVGAPSELGAVRLPGASDAEVLEKRSVQALEEQAKRASDNAAGHREAMQRAWEAQEREFPNGLQRINGEVVTQDDYRKAKAMYEQARSRNASASGMVVRKDSRGKYLLAESVMGSAMAGWRVKGRILTPEGKPFEPPHTEHVLITFGEKIEVARQSAQRWFLSNAAGLGTLYLQGNMDVRLPADKSWDIVIWSKGYEPIVIRGVRSPADLGAVRFPARNGELQEVIRR